MAKLQIQIKPDRADCQYMAGQSLSASITLFSTEKIKIEKLTVSFFLDKENRKYLGPTGTIASNLVLEGKTSKKFQVDFQIPSEIENLPGTMYIEVRAEIEESTSKTNILSLKLNARGESLGEKAGNTLISVLFSSLFLSFAALGVLLFTNGMAGKEIPYAVQWFGMACIAGGMFVAQKMLVGMNVLPNKIMGVIYLAIAALGYYIGIFNPEFQISDPVFESTGPHSLLKMFHFVSDTDIRAMHGLLLGLLGGLFAADAFITTGKKAGYFEFMISIPFLVAGALGLIYSLGVLNLQGPGYPQSLILPLLAAGIGLGIGITMCIRPTWQNAHRYIVLAGAGPLLLLAMNEALSKGAGSGFSPILSNVLAALLGISSILIFYFGNRNLFAEMRLGKVNLIYTSRIVSPGGNIIAKLEFTPKKESKINKIRTRLLCYETVRYLYNRETRYNTNTLLDRQLDFPINQSIEPGKVFNQNFEIGIPMGLPVTSTDTERTVWWEFDFVVMVDDAPDWSSREIIEVKS